jgi:hypothetical protein
LKLSKLNRELEQATKDFNFQSREVYKVIVSLSKSVTLNLNQVLITFIQINTIFYSKSQAVFAPVGSIDPNASLAAREIEENAKKNDVSPDQAHDRVQEQPQHFNMHAYANEVVNQGVSS